MALTITVLGPDGQTRKFHPGHVKDGRRHGFVYVNRTRVYGSVALFPGDEHNVTPVFTPTGTNAHLVQGTFPLVEVDEVIAAADTPDVMVPSCIEEFALSSRVD